VFNYLIRVKLPDRPGALGAVASRIGSVGGDVVSIDILERDNGIVVDELGVGLSGRNLLGLVREEILEVDGVSIESVRPLEGAIPDRQTELLDVARELFKQRSPAELLEHLAARLRRSLASNFCAVLETDSSRVVLCEGEQVGAEMSDLCGSLPLEAVERGDLAIAPMAHAGKLVIVGRDDPVIRAGERRWISTMAELADYGWQDLH
jgi:hypothetical protein